MLIFCSLQPQPRQADQEEALLSLDHAIIFCPAFPVGTEQLPRDVERTISPFLGISFPIFFLSHLSLDANKIFHWLCKSGES